MPDCENCNERCPKAEMSHEIALGRMYATNELINLVKQIESGQLVEVVRCKDCINAYRMDGPREEYDCRKISAFAKFFRPDHFCSYGERRSNEID